MEKETSRKNGRDRGFEYIKKAGEKSGFVDETKTVCYVCFMKMYSLETKNVNLYVKMRVL